MRNLLALGISFLILSCTPDESENFRVLNSERTGIEFENHLEPNSDLNIFNYIYFYNGAGVGAADFNNDGLIDLFFASNQGKNGLYINEGNLKFRDCSEKSGISSIQGWSTGVSVVDINQDGLMDIYVSQVGKFRNLNSHNLLFVCEGLDEEGSPRYKEKSAEYGLNLKGFGTQAAFIDYDLDGDLDFFQLNHSVHQNDTYNKREFFLNSYHELSGDRFFENINGKFEDKTKEVKINSSAVGYGLGLAFSDINLDGFPDIYVGNDFHENDYLYINQENKTFKDELTERIPHTSRFSMGVDIADLNNDQYSEIFSLDMLPYDPKILKSSEGEDAYYNFKFKVSMGYNIQFSRNNLQYNNAFGNFSDIGMYSGVHATDWSWGALLFDFDNDGLNDIFVSNGINKRVNDKDYISFISHEEIQNKIARGEINENDKSLIDLLPEVKIPNAFFKNSGDLKFKNIETSVKGNTPGYSNGSVYVDLDNDGDLDIVCNNINAKAFVYENISKKKNNSVRIELKGGEGNLDAIGSKVWLFCDSSKYYKENYPVRGFMSSATGPLVFGIGQHKAVDSIWVVFPDGKWIKKGKTDIGSDLKFTYSKNLPVFDYSIFIKPKGLFDEIANEIGFDYFHKENDFNDFDSEGLLPNKMSTLGPCASKLDVDGNGTEDLFIGGAKGSAGTIWLQGMDGHFKIGQVFEEEKDFEDVACISLDVNKDGLMDLIVASGGNESNQKSPLLEPRLYLNDKGKLKLEKGAFKDVRLNASCIASIDVDNDGNEELFIGARNVPYFYGIVPKSFVLKYNSQGFFEDKTKELAPEIENIGFVKNASTVEFSRNDKALFIVSEWDGIFQFSNLNKKLKKSYLTKSKGWWNFLRAIDLDQDGDLDLIAGNLGENSRIKASEKEPVQMYVFDFDDNSRLDQIITYFVGGEEVFFADKNEIEKQLPYVRKKYILSKDFASASLAEILGGKKLEKAVKFEANNFDNSYFLNDGKGNFTISSMEGLMQSNSYYCAQNYKPGHFLMFGNYFDSNIQMGLYDSDIGLAYTYDKNLGIHKVGPVLDNPIRGQIREILPIKVKEETLYFVFRNNDKALVLKERKK